MHTNSLAIRAEGISKFYRIGLKELMHDSLLRTLVDYVRKPWTNYRRYRSLYSFEDFDPGNTEPGGGEVQDVIAALHDVSFEVQHGEVMGIVGGNGAGKSTLLKILSKITAPTRGQVEIRGRVASLLEVGTGFHPELTGRENIYLNGTIMGMSKREVDRKFDEIVDFSGVERFIDTPVKRYSSGMTVRLAFAVAAHLEPEILLVDEVLAVGDAAFQKKCLGKMNQTALEGRTVVLVSHNMSAVAGLCRRAVWIDSGRVRMVGRSHDVIATYLGSSSTAATHWVRPQEEKPSGKMVLKSARLFKENGADGAGIRYGEPFSIELSYDVLEPSPGCVAVLRLENAERIVVLETLERDTTDVESSVRPVGSYRSLCRIPGGLLRHGLYHVGAAIFQESVAMIEPWRDILTFEVLPIDCPSGDGRMGIVSPIFEWRVYSKGEGSLGRRVGMA